MLNKRQLKIRLCILLFFTNISGGPLLNAQPLKNTLNKTLLNFLNINNNL